jgi:hypothetical protein
MKNRQILIVFLIGLVVTTVGGLFKIMHWPGASLMLIVGMTFEALAIVLLIAKLWKGNDKGGFLDT